MQQLLLEEVAFEFERFVQRFHTRNACAYDCIEVLGRCAGARAEDGEAIAHDEDVYRQQAERFVMRDRGSSFVSCEGVLGHDVRFDRLQGDAWRSWSCWRCVAWFDDGCIRIPHFPVSLYVRVRLRSTVHINR